MMTHFIKMISFSRLRIVPLTILVLAHLTGCQLTEKSTNDSQYSHYYLWLKSLSNQELLKETDKQKHNITGGFYEAEVNLALLYALPNSPIYNPYTAKTTLNKLTIAPEQAVQMSAADFGFISMMKDQLNQQILTLNKLILTEQLSQENQSLLQSKVSERASLMSQIQKLKQQINQLKKIEIDINNQEPSS
ncbi:hypothetical protein Q4493_15550 [Colwellia sp. 1_MG-2023]|uniref:hypothetical protein n=1 Tax=Colwellia sp. 1_MG-2023 TaxID=3062649 RepID=UPI0026E33ED9|nr:hypothetical protein [Colwellia sp. 1_MG-2023]MDO6447186.1 hypothetical protein [Colwellia sp. 1_MG-2023]